MLVGGALVEVTWVVGWEIEHLVSWGGILPHRKGAVRGKWEEEGGAKDKEGGGGRKGMRIRQG